MSRINNASPLPAVMETKLRSIRRRLAILAVLRAVAMGSSVLIVAMVLSMIADWSLTLFSTTVRTALTTVSLLLAAGAALVTGISSLIAAFGWTRVAANADEDVPELEERWTTVAHFAVSEHQPNSPTARAMLRQVTSEAAALGRLVQPRRVARPAALGSAALTFGVCGLLLAGFLALDWQQTSVLLRRFWFPTANITATQLNSITGDVTIPRGESLDIVTELSGLPRDSAMLTLQHNAGIVDVFELKPHAEQPKSFVHSLRVDDSFRYRVQAGDGRTQWRTVTAIDYPALTDVRFTITAPDYVHRPPYEKSLIPSRVKVVQGSRLELLMKPAADLERLELTLTFARDEDESADHVLTLTPDADGWYRFDAQLLEDMSLRPTLFNAHGLTNEHQHVCRIQVIPDKAPVARITRPTESMSVAKDETIDVEFEAHDDHGIATAELVVYESETQDGEEPKVLSVQEIPLAEQRLQKHVMAKAQLDLAKLNLQEGTSISYAVRVTDNRMVPINPDTMIAQMDEAKPDDPNEGARTGDAATVEGPKVGDQRPEVTDQSPFSREPQASAPSPAATSLPPDPLQDDKPSPSKNSGEPPNSDANVRPKTVAADDPPLAADGSSQDGQSPDPKTRAASHGEVSNDDSDTGTVSAETQPEGRTGGRGWTEGKPRFPGSGVSLPAVAPTPATLIDSSDGDSGSNARETPDADGSRTRPSEDPKPNLENVKPAVVQRNGDRNADSESSPASSNESRRQVRTAQGDSNTQEDTNRNDPPTSSPPPAIRIAMSPQQSPSGQNAETGRRRLKIVERLTAVAASDERRVETTQIRDRVVQIDEMLADVESGLTRVVERTIPDSDRGEALRMLEEQLGSVETAVAELRKQTKEGEFAFVGLQMVDIARSHVTPARNRVFVAIRNPNRADGQAASALQQVVRGRELLAALLKRYDRVVRDRELAESLEEAVTMYEVYVEKMHQLLRERRQTANPLQRKMGVVEVDQDYLDRYAEVLRLRREMLREFARMLGDDPRLLSRYLDLIKRRRQSLRDRLSELAERQEDVATELSGWRAVDESQRETLWRLITEMRLRAATPLAQDAAELAERIEKQMPLVLQASHGTAALAIQHAKSIAAISREMTFDAQRIIQNGGRGEGHAALTKTAEQLVDRFGELDAALDRMAFENEGNEEVTDFVNGRLLESRTVADQAEAWARFARCIEEEQYHGLAEVDQRKIAVATELLRIEMLDIEPDLEGEFQQQTEEGVPSEIVNMVHQLHRVMEDITFNQAAATFALTRPPSWKAADGIGGFTRDGGEGALERAERQQAKAVAGFERAEELFNRIRRAVIAELDEYDLEDPNIADLRDPTLDQFLARLEREPNIEAQLGIPNRPRNLRVLADTMIWQQDGGDMLGSSGEAAMQRARDAMKKKRNSDAKPKEREKTMTAEERERRQRAEQMREMLEKSLASIREKADGPDTSPEQRSRLEQMADNMQRMLDGTGQQHPDAEDWERIAQADEAKAILGALARGEPIPDQQWNKLLSTLDDGLWQVRGTSPPEEYRKAIEQYQDRIRRLTNPAGSTVE